MGDVEEITLPSGIVTFVFTDIEGSTRLLKTLGEERAADLFERHDQLLSDTWANHGGCHMGTEGDSFFVAFDDAAAAVRACADAQRQLAAEPWPEDGTVRVRMGIHTGLAAPRGGGYVSLAVHQASRVMSAGHGGQILVSDASIEQIDLTDGRVPQVVLTGIGTYQLRDFDQPVELTRVDIDRLPAIEQPVRATPAMHHNLVLARTSFVGREADLLAVSELLAPGEIVTVVGPGGVGKTRLASELGLAFAAEWPDGVWMSELADVTDEELLDEQIALSIPGAAATSGDQWSAMLEYLRDRSALLILDNSEHVIERIVSLVDELRRECPRVAVLVTSREPLNGSGERVFRLQSLASDGQTSPADSAAVRLFVDRAQAAGAGFNPDEEADTIAAICKRVDGLPLAIEIAAARAAHMNVEEIRRGLADGFELLSSRNRSHPERHRTMETMLDWSYQLLSFDEQRALRHLSVFLGSFGIDDSSEVIAGDDADDRSTVPELIWALVDKSLVAKDLSMAATRYRLPEPVQQFAYERLEAEEGPLQPARRLARRYLDRLGPWVTSDRHWLGDMASELLNIRGVVDELSGHDVELAQQLMCSVAHYHDAVHSFQAGIEEIGRTLERLSKRTPARVSLLARLAGLQLRLGSTDDAAEVLREATVVQAHVGSPRWDDVAVERAQGELLTRLGETEAAIELALRTLEKSTTTAGRARMWNLLGIATFHAEQYEESLHAFEQELECIKRIGREDGLAIANGNIAEIALRLNNSSLAAQHQLACLDGAVELGQPVLLGFSLTVAGRLAAENKDWTRAQRLLSVGVDLLERVGYELYATDRATIDELLVRTTAQTGEDRTREIGLAAAVQLAREVFEQVQRSAA